MNAQAIQICRGPIYFFYQTMYIKIYYVNI